MKAHQLLTVAGLVAALAWTSAAEAGVFSVSPVRIYMGARDRAVAVTVTNEGDTELVIQADINAWTQDREGKDSLTLTEDLVLAPPIIKLAPKARQVVRLALLRPADRSQQMIYRLILREVPEALPQNSGLQVPIALALSLPVFITPPDAKPAVACEVRRADAKAFDAACRNTGNAYAQVREITLRRGSTVLGKFEGGSYILPGAVRSVRIESTESVPPGAAQAQVEFDRGAPLVLDVALP